MVRELFPLILSFDASLDLQLIVVIDFRHPQFEVIERFHVRAQSLVFELLLVLD